MLQGHKTVMDHVSFLHDIIQATAHAQRPLVHAAQSMSIMRRLMSRLASLVTGQEHREASSIVEGADTLARFAYTAVTDASDCLARLDSEALRHLRAQWMESACFPSMVKEAVKRDPLPPGIAPTREHVEFTAPIVGDTLPHHYEDTYARAKSEQVLSK